MKIYEIRDDKRKYGYLFYYSKTKTFYIELDKKVKKEDSTIFFYHFIENGQYSIDSYWSKMWVVQRVVPIDRQNIGDILKSSHMDEYDEYLLLIKNDGRCSQDDLYITEIDYYSINKEIKERFVYRLEDVIVSKNSLLCFFKDKSCKRITFDVLISINEIYKSLLTNEELVDNFVIQPDGYGIIFNDSFLISNMELYNYGIDVDVDITDFTNYVNYRLLNTTEACKLLDCSRQNINDLVKRDKLHPIRVDERNYLFSKNEIEQRLKTY